MILPFLRGALVLMWMTLIFIFSSQAGTESSALSSGVADTLINVVEVVQSDFSQRIDVQAFESSLRFWAHFFLYFTLGVFLYDFLRSFYSDYFRLIIETSMIALLIAILDETLQSSVPGRAMQITDIYTDFFGALLAAFLLSFLFYKMKRVS